MESFCEIELEHQENLQIIQQRTTNEKEQPPVSSKVVEQKENVSVDDGISVDMLEHEQATDNAKRNQQLTTKEKEKPPVLTKVLKKVLSKESISQRNTIRYSYMYLSKE